jgi:hypothetical protein
VGAFRDNVGANTDQGSAYVFTRSGTTWTQQAKLTAGDGVANDSFGYSVALSGDTALVGDNQDDIGANTDQGSAYIFTRSGTTWTQQAKLTAGDGAAYDSFGFSVALSGNTALVGAYRDYIGANTNVGSAYVFVRSGTSWAQQARLTASPRAGNSYFGRSVAISGDTALVGMCLNEFPDYNSQTSAYIFTRSGETWMQQARLTSPSAPFYDNFGCSVSLSGDTALVGAFFGESAYVFNRRGTDWMQPVFLAASDGTGIYNDSFGAAVAVSDDTALVGAMRDMIGSNAVQGSAYFYNELPIVVSSLCADPNPTHAASVNFIVTFSEAVTGVDASDFAPDAIGHLTGVSVTGVSGSGAIYTVSVSTGVGIGRLGLVIPLTANINDLTGYPLGGLPYISGEVYKVGHYAHLPLVLTSTQ